MTQAKVPMSPCNTAITLCHMTDKMMCSYLKRLEKIFVTKGGIKERMHSARTGYRKDQDKQFAELKAENARLKAELAELKKALGRI